MALEGKFSSFAAIDGIAVPKGFMGVISEFVLVMGRVS